MRVQASPIRICTSTIEVTASRTELAERLFAEIGNVSRRIEDLGRRPVLVVSARLRPALRRLLPAETRSDWKTLATTTLSNEEILEAIGKGVTNRILADLEKLAGDDAATAYSSRRAPSRTQPWRRRKHPGRNFAFLSAYSWTQLR